MLEDHERAARMPNETNVTWHHFVSSRFIGQASRKAGGTSLAIDIQSVALVSYLDAELRGLLEYSTTSALPVVFEFTGTLNLETRDVFINNAHEGDPERSYAGSFSENGRVLTLRSLAPGEPPSKPLQLIHEGTLQELFGD